MVGAVTGPSGSGKSSLLAVIAGLVRPAAGEVYLDGAPLTGFAGPARGLALVLQGSWWWRRTARRWPRGATASWTCTPPDLCRSRWPGTRTR
jgi:energy-coupling factor transporter ATP-binding protein EcfA2